MVTQTKTDAGRGTGNHKIARQLRLAGQELRADVEDPFADLVARKTDAGWRDHRR